MSSTQRLKEEDGPDFRIVRTGDGVLTRCWKHTGAPRPIEFALRTRQDWHRLRERLVPGSDRFAFGYYGDCTYEYTSGPVAAVRQAYQKCPTLDETYFLVSITTPTTRCPTRSAWPATSSRWISSPGTAATEGAWAV